jgi:DnaK suppressor protein
MDEGRARERLREERERVERAIKDLVPGVDEELSHLDQHLADQGTDLFENERDMGRLEQLREELAAIERAEQRLAEGTFGLSVESGKPIPDERLELMPWAERTVEEQARYGRR